jgi:hypothetical protein
VIFRTRSSSETILFLIYAYRGEGDSAVWFKGRYYPDFDIGFTKRSDGAWCHGEHCPATYVDMGKTVWWAEVRLKSGVIVWVDMDGAVQFASLTVSGYCSTSLNFCFIVQGFSNSSQFASAVAQANARKRASRASAIHSAAPRTKLPEQLDTHWVPGAEVLYLPREHLARGKQHILDKTTFAPPRLRIDHLHTDFGVVRILGVPAALNFPAAPLKS